MLVKPPNARGRGRSWVERLPEPAGNGVVFVKRQRGYYCRPVWAFGRRVPTARRELRALRAFDRLGVGVPEVVRYEEGRGLCTLALAGVADALDFDEALERHAEDAAVVARNVAVTIARLHGSGWNHGALYPSHILVGPAPAYQVTLIDLEKATRSWLHEPDLDRLMRYARFPSPELAHWFEACYEAAREGATVKDVPRARE